MRRSSRPIRRLQRFNKKTLDAKVALEEAEHASSTLTEKVRSLESQIELTRVQLQTNQEVIVSRASTAENRLNDLHFYVFNAAGELRI